MIMNHVQSVRLMRMILTHSLTRILLFISTAFILNSCEQTPALSQDVDEIVLQTIAMESANQPILGQAYVAKTIQTRARRGKISPRQAVLVPKQYSCWNSPKWAKAWLDTNYTPKARQNALEAWQMASRLPMVSHYHTRQVRPYWASSMQRIVIVGQHHFYKEVR